MRNITTEFPGYELPAELAALVAAGKLIDESWRNDACPCFVLRGESGVRVWVEHQDPARRESPRLNGPTPRFIVALYDADETFLDTAEETNSIEELLAYLKDHWEI